jgi:hypothetical protein
LTKCGGIKFIVAGLFPAVTIQEGIVRHHRDSRNESAFARAFAALQPGHGLAFSISLALAVCFVVALPVAAARADGSAQLLPPITEEAQFRSACTASGEEILAANLIRAALSQEQVSRYSPRTSRCYVEMRVQTLDRPAHLERFGRFLYDGQTKELLAFAEIKDRRKSGRVFDLYHRTTTFENAGWDDANEYIHTMMMDGE